MDPFCKACSEGILIRAPLSRSTVLNSGKRKTGGGGCESASECREFFLTEGNITAYSNFFQFVALIPRLTIPSL
jgi:hypothetical protein